MILKLIWKKEYLFVSGQDRIVDGLALADGKVKHWWDATTNVEMIVTDRFDVGCSHGPRLRQRSDNRSSLSIQKF